MQGLADGYFILRTPSVITWRRRSPPRWTPRIGVPSSPGRSERALRRLLAASAQDRGRVPPRAGPRDVGQLRMSRNAAGLTEAMTRIGALRDEFWKTSTWRQERDLNQSLEHAGRVADFLEFAELMCHDALQRESRAAATSARNTRRRT